MISVEWVWHITPLLRVSQECFTSRTNSNSFRIKHTHTGLRLVSSVQDNTDIDESDALAWQSNVIHIYSNSWGPSDDGIEVSGPGPLMQRTLETGAREVGF